MQYLNMRPHQLREAIRNNTPVALPPGVIEYHAKHVDMERQDDRIWYTRTAKAASAKYGDAALEAEYYDLEHLMFKK